MNESSGVWRQNAFRERDGRVCRATAQPIAAHYLLAPLLTMPIYVNGAVPDPPARSVRLWQAVPGPPGQEVADPVAVPLVEGVVARQDLVALRVPLFAEMPLDTNTTENDIKLFANYLQKVWSSPKSCANSLQIVSEVFATKLHTI